MPCDSSKFASAAGRSIELLRSIRQSLLQVFLNQQLSIRRQIVSPMKSLAILPMEKRSRVLPRNVDAAQDMIQSRAINSKIVHTEIANR